MASQLAVIESQFKPLIPRMDAAIPANAGFGGRRVMESILIACEKQPRLMECKPITLHQSAFSACALGLLVDGVTGQAYVIPYKDEAQFQIGFKGFSTIAGRSHFMLGGDVIYEGEQYEIVLGTGGRARVEWDPTKRYPGAKIIGAFATLESSFAPPLVVAMSLDEIESVRQRSAAVKSGRPTPWNNPADYAQMAIKTAKKRLGKSCPLDILQIASALDDAVDQGHSAYIRPEDRALIVDHEAAPVTPMQPPPAQDFSIENIKFEFVQSNGVVIDLGSLARWREIILQRVMTVKSGEQIQAAIERNEGTFAAIAKVYPNDVAEMRQRLQERVRELG